MARVGCIHQCPVSASTVAEPKDETYLRTTPAATTHQRQPSRRLRMRGDNCGITEIVVTPKGQASLGRFADTGHLGIEQTTFH